MECYNEKLSLEHFRLQSLRRKKRWKRVAFEKKLLKLHEEERAISKQLWNLGYKELDPPVQRGWKRYFVLREDISRSKDAKFFQSILDKINTVEYSWKKDFKVKRRQRGKKIYVVRVQELARLGAGCFQRKKFTENEIKYFDLVLTRKGVPGEGLWLYVFREPWRFKLKVEPNIIRRTRIKDFDLERRGKEIREYFERNNLRPKMFKLIHGSYQWRLRYDYEGELPKYEYNPFRNRSFADILNEYFPDNTSIIIKNKPSNSEGLFFASMFDHAFGRPRAKCMHKFI